jgi:hypothetical protein
MVTKGIILATARFHHPAHVQDWTSDSIDDNFNAVWNIIIHGIVHPK